MNKPQLPSWITPLIIAVAIPTIACFAYYFLDELNSNDMFREKNSSQISAVILAYPTSLIGLIGLVMTHYSPKKSLMKYSTWGACMLFPIVFLLFVRAQGIR
ncbi:MAG: hypothetical protein V7722_06860 [Porticoccus sp.]